MSSTPIPVSAGATPFVPTTTPTIERANRLISVRTHPGFLDVLRISQEIVQSAVDVCRNYPGWDERQLIVLHARMKCAEEHHQLLIAKINEAIRDGIAESSSQSTSLPEKSASDAVDQGDYVRQQVLQKFDEQDNRPAGSY